MDWIREFFSKRRAIVLAFVPVVNIIYIIIHYFTVDESLLAFGKKLLVAVPFVAGYWFLPENWYWLVTHLAVSTATAVMMYHGRGRHQQIAFKDFPPLKLLVVSMLLLAILLTSYVLVSTSPQSQSADRALHALVSGDEETWQSLMHPVHGKDLMDLDEVLDTLAKQGTVLSGECNIYNKISIGSAKGYIDGATRYEKEVNIGGLRYYCTFIYLENEEGSGFIDFWMH